MRGLKNYFYVTIKVIRFINFIHQKIRDIFVTNTKQI